MTPKYEIRNIRRGKGSREHFIYAQLFVNGELAMSATLEDISLRLKRTLVSGGSNVA